MSKSEIPPIAGDYMKNALYARVIMLPTETEQPLLASAPQPNPAWNGKLLMNPAGTVWVVIDGLARGYTNEPLFSRVHGWRRQVQECYPTHHGAGHRCGPVWTNTVFTRISDIAVIQQGPVMAQDATIISNSAGSMFLFENNTIRGIPSGAVMDKYQFNWDTGKGNVYGNDTIARLHSVGVIE